MAAQPSQPQSVCQELSQQRSSCRGAGPCSSQISEAGFATYKHGISYTNLYSSIYPHWFLFREESIRSSPPTPHTGHGGALMEQ